MQRPSIWQQVIKSAALWILLISMTFTGWIMAAWLWFSRPIPEPQTGLSALLKMTGKAATAAPPALEYKDFIAILLTAIGVLIACLALILALAAVWGFAGIKEVIVAAATKTAAETASETATKVAQSISARTSVSMNEAGWDEPKNETDGDYGEAAAKENGNDRKPQ